MSSSWNGIATYTIPEGRNKPIVFPKLLSSPYVAVRVTPYKKNKWRKSGDLNQQFKEQIQSPDFFVGWDELTSYKMDNNFGKYQLVFTPVPYHKGFVIQAFELAWILRINCGGGLYVDSNSNTWIADSYFTGGQTYVYTDLNIPIPTPPPNLELDSILFQDERSGLGFSYQIPVENARYDVFLYFNESGFNNVDRRVFSVFVNDQTIERLDIFAEAGKDKVIVKKINLLVSTGFISISFAAIKDNPQINAIEIFKTS